MCVCLRAYVTVRVHVCAQRNGVFLSEYSHCPIAQITCQDFFLLCVNITRCAVIILYHQMSHQVVQADVRTADQLRRRNSLR